MTGFHKATKAQSKLRMAITGPSGSGKTYSALAVASAFGNVAVIDTERGSASKYADLFEFDVLELTEYHPRSYIDAIKLARDNGYQVLVIDSLSHAWAGQGGVLELVDRAAKRTKSENKFAAWRDVTPLHNQLVDTILGMNLHIIATIRSKMDYVLEPDENGKLKPRKVGLGPVQRDGMEYEFDVVAEMDMENNLMISKSRCIPLTNAVISRPDAKLGETLRAWLSDGVAVTERPAPVQQPVVSTTGVPEERPGEAELRTLPQTLGELKQIAIVERRWVKSGAAFEKLMKQLVDEGAVEDGNYPAAYLAMERHFNPNDVVGREDERPESDVAFEQV